LIVGIDSGITTGIAILDAHGNIVTLESKRDATRNDIIKFISRFGKPLVIASDVNPMPKKIKRLARSLGSRIYYPEISLSNVEKTKIIKDYLDEIEDIHQKDALAAGLKALKNYRELITKVEHTLKKFDRKEIFDTVIMRLLKSGDENITDTIKSIIKKESR